MQIPNQLLDLFNSNYSILQAVPFFLLLFLFLAVGMILKLMLS